MALMYSDDRSDMLFAIGIIIAIAVGVTGFIFAMIGAVEWAKDSEARRCAEYGYECPKED